jgi:hypothetical protein
LSKSKLVIAFEAVQQGLPLLLLGGQQRQRRFSKLATDESGKAVTTALEVGKSPICLQLQPLGQGNHPAVEPLL